MGPNPVTGVHIRRGKFGHIDTHREEGHVNSEAEIGDAATGKECQDYCNHQKQRGRGKEAYFTRACRRSTDLPTP